MLYINIYQNFYSPAAIRFLNVLTNIKHDLNNRVSISTFKACKNGLKMASRWCKDDLKVTEMCLKLV